MRIHRLLPLLSLLAPLCGCGPEMGGIAAASAAAIPVFQRTFPDMVVSAATGRDCSLVRLDQGKSYCRDTELLPDRQPFCTRSLGVVDCWANPQALPGPPARPVADGPHGLTPAQEAYRTRGWPGF